MADLSHVSDSPVGPGATWSDALRAVMLPFLISRAGVLIVGVVAAVLIGYTPVPGEPSAWLVDPNPVRNLLARWDSFWYFDIASRGYQWNGNPLEQQNVVFFPLFPLLMRVIGAAIGGHPLVAGMLVSLSAFLLALTYVWRWTADHVDADAATGAVWLLSAFPFALFFSVAYTESLFLLLFVAACYHTERRQFARSAVAGFLGGLVRPNGFLLCIPVGWIAWIKNRDRRRPIGRLLAAVATIAPLVGVAVFCAYLWWRFGSPTAWIADQAAWPNNFGRVPPPAKNSIDGNWLSTLLSLLFAIAAIIPVTKLFGAAYGLFATVNIAVPVLRHGVLSAGRFTSVMFPTFAWLSTFVRGRRRRWLIAAFALGQIATAALFFTWRAII
jgi:hypothetical protein